MPRGRQYYDPIIQAPSRVESAGNKRIELFPEGDVTDSAPGPLRWVARLIGDDGLIVEKSPGSFDHDDALRQAQERWPGLEVFELREESEDSTHEGMGPSPRLWQHPLAEEENAMALRGAPTPAAPDAGHKLGHVIGQKLVGTPEEREIAATALRAFIAVSPGAYVLLEDIVVVLEEYAVQYDGQGNPSGALALREAAAALREPF